MTSKIVPREPTQEMDDAASNVDRSNLPGMFRREVWRAMYDAAPAMEKPAAAAESDPLSHAWKSGYAQAKEEDRMSRDFCPHCNPCLHDGGEKCRNPEPPAAAAPPATDTDDLCARLMERGKEWAEESNDYLPDGITAARICMEDAALYEEAADRIAELRAEVERMARGNTLIAQEAKLEWARATNAEAERDRLREELGRATGAPK